MDIGIKDILTLSNDNQYVVVSKAYYNGNDYLYLVNVNDNKDMKFCCVENDSVIEIDNKELNTKLLLLFFNNSKDIFLKQFKEND